MQDGTLWLWESASRQILCKLTVPNSQKLQAPTLTAAGCSPDGLLLVTGTAAPMLLVWGLQYGKRPRAGGALQYIIHLPEHAGSVIQLDLMADSQTAAGETSTLDS